MKKRPLAWVLTLCLLLGCLTPAGADVGALDRALDRWLAAYPNVRFSATLSLTALQPFGADTVAMLSTALGHLTLTGELSREGDASTSGARATLGDTELFSFTESETGGAYTFTTSLLPNRNLTSAALDPFTLLTDAQAQADADTAAAEAAATAEAAAGADAQPAAQALNGSEIENAYSALDAITELNACYKALTDGITPLAEEKRANYNIKGIGAGRWSRVARLTPEQSEALLPQLRAVLACGMDDAYRAEVAQMTFAKGFVVALYQNSDKQDICLYLKGTVIYPDGDKRKLLFQWAFTTNGIQRKDTIKYEVARLSGTLDSRLIAATYTVESRSDAFLIDGKTETTLRRAKATDKSTARVNLSGAQDAALVMTCDGTVSQELAYTIGTDTQRETQKAEVALRITPDAEGAVLSGTVGFSTLRDKAVQTAFTLTLAGPQAAQGEPAATPDAGTASNALNDLDAIAGLFADTGATGDSGAADAATGPATSSEGSDAAVDTVVGTDSPMGTDPAATVALDGVGAPDATAATGTPDVPGAPGSTGDAATAGDGTADAGAAGAAAGAAGAQGTVAGGQSDYLVGSAPLGLQEYHTSQGMTTIALDGATGAQRLALFTEAAQNLAARLVLGLASLPQADAAILYDGLTEQDAAALTALLNALR